MGRNGTKKGYPVRAVVQVHLTAQKDFFDADAARLLEMIDQTGSIQDACMKTGISYSKGAKMIKNAEKQLGFRLLERRTGGSGGRGSRLTEAGRKLVDQYRRMLARVQKDADHAYRECFAGDLSEIP